MEKYRPFLREPLLASAMPLYKGIARSYGRHYAILGMTSQHYQRPDAPPILNMSADGWPRRSAT